MDRNLDSKMLVSYLPPSLCNLTKKLKITSITLCAYSPSTIENFYGIRSPFSSKSINHWVLRLTTNSINDVPVIQLEFSPSARRKRRLCLFISDRFSTDYTILKTTRLDIKQNLALAEIINVAVENYKPEEELSDGYQVMRWLNTFVIHLLEAEILTGDSPIRAVRGVQHELRTLWQFPDFSARAFPFRAITEAKLVPLPLRMMVADERRGASTHAAFESVQFGEDTDFQSKERLQPNWWTDSLAYELATETLREERDTSWLLTDSSSAQTGSMRSSLSADTEIWSPTMTTLTGNTSPRSNPLKMNSQSWTTETDPNGPVSPTKNPLRISIEKWVHGIDSSYGNSIATNYSPKVNARSWIQATNFGLRPSDPAKSHLEGNAMRLLPNDDPFYNQLEPVDTIYKSQHLTRRDMRKRQSRFFPVG